MTVYILGICTTCLIRMLLQQCLRNDTRVDTSYNNGFLGLSNQFTSCYFNANTFILMRHINKNICNGTFFINFIQYHMPTVQTLFSYCIICFNIVLPWYLNGCLKKKSPIYHNRRLLKCSVKCKTLVRNQITHFEILLIIITNT